MHTLLDADIGKDRFRDPQPPGIDFLALFAVDLAFISAAQSVKQAECAFRVLYRRLRARLGPAQATVATAHAIARVVYRMLRYQAEYEPLSMSEYEKQYYERQIKYLEKKAAKFGFQLAPAAA